MRTQSSSHLDFSFVRPWAENPAISWPDFWSKQKTKIVIACHIPRWGEGGGIFFLSICWPSLLVTGIPTYPKYSFLETKYFKSSQGLTSPLALFVFLHSDPYYIILLYSSLLPGMCSACLFFVISKVILNLIHLFASS